MIVGGERRWRAHQLPPCVEAGLTTIKCIVDHDMTDDEADAMMVAENTGRVDLGILDEARAYRKLVDKGMTVEAIAQSSGVAPFRVQWRLDILALSPEVQEALNCGMLPSACALELRRLGPDHQIAALKAWQANPTMGHIPFKRKCIEWADAAQKNAQVGLFGDPTDDWVEQAKAIKAKTGSVPKLRAMIVELTTALEAIAAHSEVADAMAPLVQRARDMV